MNTPYQQDLAVAAVRALKFIYRVIRLRSFSRAVWVRAYENHTPKF